MDMETLIAELTARLDALEDIVEEMRYAGPAPREDYGGRMMYEAYEDLLDGEWDL